MQNSVISFENVTVSIGSECILEKVSFVLHHEESIGIIGPSGSGKSVLLKTAAGLLFPQSGLMQKGKALRLTMTFQRSGLFDSLTAYENLSFPLKEVGGLSKAEIESRIKQNLKDVGLEGQGGLFPHEMSGGMQKRLGIARALSLRPDIVLYDDPTAGLDPVTSRQIVELILQMKEKYRMATLVVSSELNVAYALSDSIIFLHQGKVVEHTGVETFRNSSNPYVHQFVNGLIEGPMHRE